MHVKRNPRETNHSCHCEFASPAAGGQETGRTTASSSPIRACRATAASSSGSAPTTRWCPRIIPSASLLKEDRIKHWLGVGARPSDRVARFLGAADLIKVPARSEQTKQHLPKAKAQERAKAAEEAKAAAEAEAAEAKAAPAEEAPAEEAPAEEAPAKEASAPETPAEEPKAEEKPAEDAKAEAKPAEGRS